MGMALKGIRCVNNPPPQGLADTGNLNAIVSTNWVTCLYLHLRPHICPSYLDTTHLLSVCIHTRTEPGNNLCCTCLQSRPTPKYTPPQTSRPGDPAPSPASLATIHAVSTSLYSCSPATCASAHTDPGTTLDPLDSPVLYPFMMRQAYQNCTGMTTAPP